MTNNGYAMLNNENFEVIDLTKDRDVSHSWKVHNKLLDEKIIERVTPEHMYQIGLQLKDVRDISLFFVLYLTAARAEEIVQYQKIKWGRKKVYVIDYGYDRPKKKTVQDYDNKIKVGDLRQGIMKRDIYLRKIKGVNCIVFNIRNLKNKTLNKKEVAIRLDREVNYKMAQWILSYTRDLYEYQELFMFGLRNAERILKKVGWNPHSLRRVRLTHLVRYEKYSEQLLKLYAGWTDTRPSKHYIKLNYEDMIF